MVTYCIHFASFHWNYHWRLDIFIFFLIGRSDHVASGFQKKKKRRNQFEINTVHLLRFAAKVVGSMLVSEKLRTHPFPYPTSTLTCSQLTVVGLGEGCAHSLRY